MMMAVVPTTPRMTVLVTVILSSLLLAPILKFGNSGEFVVVQAQSDSYYQELYQDGEYLCVDDGVCYDADDLDYIIQTQLEQSLEHHRTGEACHDVYDYCRALSQKGDCTSPMKKQRIFMHAYCSKTCRVCHNRSRTHVPHQQSFAKHYDKAEYGAAPLVDAFGSDMGVPQILKGAPRRQIVQRLRQAHQYLQDEILYDDKYRLVRDKCRNTNPQCAAWAVKGDCDNNYDYMWNHCAPVCFSCDQLHYEARCPIDPDIKHAWYPGDLNAMFERIVNSREYIEKHNVTVLSRPDYAEYDTEQNATYQLGPWVVTLDDFTTPAEREKLIEAGGLIGYERSEDVGEEHDDGEIDGVVSEGRTSTNAWCEHDECESEPLVDAVLERIELLTGLSRNYSEQLQLLRYEPGQFYEVHHDYIETDKYRIQGVRILTVFLYLNDVEEGGGTNFPRLDLTVIPKAGKAVLWPSVYDEKPHEQDERTHHQALPVEKGIKYGANAWLHQRQVRVAYNMGC